MSKAHLSHDCSVKRISICWDFTPKKMGGESCLVMNVLWVTYADTQGVNHPRLNLKSMRIQKSVKTQRIWWIRWGGITPWQIITCKNNKRQVLFHVRSPTSGNKLLGNKLSLQRKSLGSHGTCKFSAIMLHAAAPGLAARGLKPLSKLAFWCGSMYKYYVCIYIYINVF